MESHLLGEGIMTAWISPRLCLEPITVNVPEALPEWKCLHRGLVRCGSQLDGLSTLAVLGAHAAYPYVGPLVGYRCSSRLYLDDSLEG